MENRKVRPGEPADDLCFYSMLSVLQGGMWLLNDIEKFLVPFGLSHGRFSILLALMESPEETGLPGKMSKILGKSKPTITRMVEKLDNEGYLETQEDPEDRRRRRLILTEQANALLSRIVPQYRIRIRAMCRHLSAEEKYALMKSISKINFLDPEKQIMVKR